MTQNFSELALKIKSWGDALGFQQIGITDTQLNLAEKRLQDWLAKSFHGDMNYMESHGLKRSRPELLIPGTIRVISARMDYLPEKSDLMTLLDHPKTAYIARYALGRDYHKLIRKRLERLAQQIREEIPETQYRVFADSAPILEKPLAEKAGLGWQGKHTNLIHAKAGSWFFLGTIYTNLPLPLDQPSTNHCGSCQACMDICPTKAIIGPYQLDARRCIAYLTIEYHGIIPEVFRKPIGNRVFGCDDCQIVCPWNKFAKVTKESAFLPRAALNNPALLELFSWDEKTFLKNTEGSAIRRIGFISWQRNLAIALGNAKPDDLILTALQEKLKEAGEILRVHLEWAIEQQRHV